MSIKSVLFGFVLSSTSLAAGMILAHPKSATTQASLPYSQEMQRTPIPNIGGWTIVDCSAAAAATSSVLNEWSRYVAQCRSDAYIATGDEATDSADANDGYLPAGAWFEFGTTDTIKYISFKNVATDTDCRIWEML